MLSRARIYGHCPPPFVLHSKVPVHVVLGQMTRDQSYSPKAALYTPIMPVHVLRWHYVRMTSMAARNQFATVDRRLSQFFQSSNYTNVRGLCLFGY